MLQYIAQRARHVQGGDVVGCFPAVRVFSCFTLNQRPAQPLYRSSADLLALDHAEYDRVGATGVGGWLHPLLPRKGSPNSGVAHSAECTLLVGRLSDVIRRALHGAGSILMEAENGERGGRPRPPHCAEGGNSHPQDRDRQGKLRPHRAPGLSVLDEITRLERWGEGGALAGCPSTGGPSLDVGQVAGASPRLQVEGRDREGRQDHHQHCATEGARYTSSPVSVARVWNSVRMLSSR